MPSDLYTAPLTPLSDVSLTAQGLKAQTFDRLVANVNTGKPDFATVYLMGIAIRAGSVIANMHIGVTQSGAGSSASFLGLYDKTGALLTISANQGAAWDSQGLKTVAVTTYTAAATDYYYAGLVTTATSTTASILRAGGAGGQQIVTAIGTGVRPFATGGTAQTTLPATVTLSSTSPLGFWVGVS